jgi:hypothetical protein
MTSPFFSALPTLSILRSAFKQEEDFETVDLSEFQTPPSTPPLLLKEDLFSDDDVQIISQEEFLAAVDRRFEREFSEYCNQAKDDPWMDIE